jgi:hypothetical protein
MQEEQVRVYADQAALGNWPTPPVVFSMKPSWQRRRKRAIWIGCTVSNIANAFRSFQSALHTQPAEKRNRRAMKGDHMTAAKQE